MKLNSKGFSLVEILAVIVIIGIVSAIGIVSVTRLIDNSKKHFYDTQEKQIVLAAQSYANDHKNILPKDIGAMTRITLQDLIDSKYIEGNIEDEAGNPCYTKPDTIKDKDGKSINIDGTYVDILKSSQTEYKYNGTLQCEKCLEERSYKRATCSTSKTKLKPSIIISIPKIDSKEKGNTIFNKNDTIKITIDAVDKTGSYDQSINVVSYSYKIYVDNELKKNSGTKINNKKNQIYLDNEKIFQYVPGKVKVVVTATNTEGQTTTKSSSSDLSDAASPLCGKVTYDNNNQMKNYEYVTPDDIDCGTANYPWINIGTKPGDRHVWIKCEDQEGVGCALSEYSLYLDKDGVNQDVEIKDTKDNKYNCSVKKCIDKTTSNITFNIRSSKTGSAKKKFTIKGQSDNLNYKQDETYNTWLNKENYPNGVFLDVEIKDPTSEIRTFTWTESDSAESINKLGGANTNVSTKRNISKEKYESISHKITEDGYRIEKVRVEDYAGNIVTFNLTIKVDRTNPSCNIDSFSNECKNSGVSAKVFCNDDMSGVKTCAGTSKSNDKNTNVSKTGLKKDTTYKVVDDAGNSSSCSTKIYNETQWRKATCSSCGRCSGAGCNTYNTCQNSACGTETRCNRWDGSTCLGSRNYTKSCATAACGCKTYNQSCPTCGCGTWGSWGSWSYNKLDCNGATKGTCKTDTQLVYRHQTQKCKDGIDNPSNKKIKCSAGNYLPATKSSCATCKSGYYCPGGEWYQNNTKDQGLNDCPAGYKNSPAGSSKINQCFMNVPKNNYVAKAKDSNSTKCPPGRIKDYHKVNYGDVSACQLYSAKKYNGIYLQCKRNESENNWPGRCSHIYRFNESGISVGTWKVTVKDNILKVQGYCNVNSLPGYKYTYNIYALDSNGDPDMDTLLYSFDQYINGQEKPPFNPNVHRASVEIDWNNQTGKRGSPIGNGESDCYDHGNHY